MNTVGLIEKKRDGLKLNEEEIEFFISSFTKGKIPDYQASALLMAIYLNGMDKTETSVLTNAMLNSGKVINLDSLKGRKIDKHSTGGVGDKTSLIIAPIVAAAGLYVPMISGRGLGHTGGTLDKLESIPGFSTQLTTVKFKSVLKKCGLSLIGQTKDIAPADKLLYALRDVTATIASVPLITGSIMSKKLAEGIDGLVLDIKTGNGAFMEDQKDARNLANSLVDTAKSFDKKVIALITDMNQPLGNNIGNWLEVVESIEVLQGKAVPDLLGLSLNLAGAMLMLGGKVKSIEDGIELAHSKIIDGTAFSKFVEMVELQGGDIKFINDISRYPKSKYIEKIFSTKNGYLHSVNTKQIGVLSSVLGAGRFTMTDVIDPKAGIKFYKKIGDKVQKNELVAELHSNRKKQIDIVKDEILKSFEIKNKSVKKIKLIKEIIN